MNHLQETLFARHYHKYTNWKYTAIQNTLQSFGAVISFTDDTHCIILNY